MKTDGTLLFRGLTGLVSALRSLISPALALLLLLSMAASAPAENYRNPVLRGMNPDPSVVRVGERYYLTTSTFEYFPGCALYSSLDLTHWEMIGYALHRPEQFAALKSEHPALYACTLRYHDGTFYVLTTDVNAGHVNFIVSATNPAGPWSDPLTIDHGMFDPSIFFDDDGKVYYQRRGPGRGQNIVQAEIDVRTGKLLTPLRTISTGFVTADAEGPHLYKIDGWYYLSEAEGGTEALHQQAIGRSHSPWGPFAPNPANPWATQHTDWGFPVHGVGHCDLVETPGSEWWTVCLGTRNAFSLGRETFLFRVRWQDGWPAIDPKDLKTLEVEGGPAAKSPLHNEPERDDFNGPQLGLNWNTIGPLGPANMSLAARPGYLRLYGKPDELSFQKPTAFVGRRQAGHELAATAKLDFEPQADGERAGLTAFMSPSYHYDMVKVRRGGQNFIQLAKQVSDLRTVAAEAPVGSGPVLLRIESDGRRYSFSFAAAEGKWVPLGSADAHLISSEVADVWTGAYIGMFSVSPDPAHGAPADFDWFEFRAEK
ncbi:MAG: glycoside hydrolase family 43 protein [Terracidiphilus sp.]|nr:glycoside hydrolase family 43 protein [Terracidiphilus sp.]MDR3775992.1 glycoside hydrolase family 43 protein [Terracidiphilus sp.]